MKSIGASPGTIKLFISLKTSSRSTNLQRRNGSVGITVTSAGMFSGFGDEAFSKLYEGAMLLVPLLHPNIDVEIFPILGRIISRG